MDDQVGFQPGNYGDYSLLPIDHDPFATPKPGKVVPPADVGQAARAVPGQVLQASGLPDIAHQIGNVADVARQGGTWTEIGGAMVPPLLELANPEADEGAGLGAAVGKVLADVHPSWGGTHFLGDVHPSSVSQRLPTGVDSEDPVANNLSISLASMKLDPKQFAKNMNVVRTQYGTNFTPEELALPDDQLANVFIDHVKSNLLWLHDHPSIQDWKDRGSLWYDGANYIAQHRADYYNKPLSSVAGVYASLSPQKDWYQNVSLGDRVMHIMSNHADDAWTPEMTQTANRILWKKAGVDKAGNPTPAGIPPDKQALLANLQNNTINSLDSAKDKAWWLRIYDETNHDRTFPSVMPEGNYGSPVLTDKINKATGERIPAKVAWGSSGEIGNAIKAYLSDGSREQLSPLWTGHKVRDFYNNILDPNSKAGDVTIDTHAVAAGLLQPLSANTPEVTHNFGSSLDKKFQPPGYKAASNSDVTGANGLYGLYADAYRQAAAERGILPRQMQSITWEAGRGLFGEDYKTAQNLAAVKGMWQQRAEGASINDIRQAIHDHAGGIDKPTWHSGPQQGD